MFFGFGKALDLLRDGDLVRRHEWAPNVSLYLQQQEQVLVHLSNDPRPRPMTVQPAQLMKLSVAANGDSYTTAWAPDSEDLLADDWERWEHVTTTFEVRNLAGDVVARG